MINLLIRFLLCLLSSENVKVPVFCVIMCCRILSSGLEGSGEATHCGDSVRDFIRERYEDERLRKGERRPQTEGFTLITGV